MRVMIAGLTASRQYYRSTESFYKLELQDGDAKYVQHGTRGDVGREMICSKFLESEYDALMMCDLDQVFPKDALTKLRAHDKDMVSGHYMKRSTKSLMSIWQYTLDGEWPYLPYFYGEIPMTGLHRIATTGLGCALIKRKALEDVRNFLPPGSNPFSIGLVPEITTLAANFGSDYRFFFYAQKLGHELWGDADVDCPHASTTWLSRTVLDEMKMDSDKIRSYLFEKVFRNTIRSKGMITLNAVEARLRELNEAAKTCTAEQQPVVDGQIAEIQFWRDLLAKESPPQPVQPFKEERVFKSQNNQVEIKLPTFKNMGEAELAIENRKLAINGETPERVVDARRTAMKNQAVAAVRRMNGRNPEGIETSTEQGEMNEL